MPTAAAAALPAATQSSIPAGASAAGQAHGCTSGTPLSAYITPVGVAAGGVFGRLDAPPVYAGPCVPWSDASVCCRADLHCQWRRQQQRNTSPTTSLSALRTIDVGEGMVRVVSRRGSGGSYFCGCVLAVAGALIQSAAPSCRPPHARLQVCGPAWHRGRAVCADSEAA